MEFEHAITVVGAVVCLLYGWLIGVAARAGGISSGIHGPVIGIIGTVVLAGLALTGNADVQRQTEVDSEYTAEGYPKVSKGAVYYEQLLSIAARTTEQYGLRPSTNHVAYEYSNGDLAWVTKEEYREFLRNK